jgi:hypothetical protein
LLDYLSAIRSANSTLKNTARDSVVWFWELNLPNLFRSFYWKNRGANYSSFAQYSSVYQWTTIRCFRWPTSTSPTRQL